MAASGHDAGQHLRNRENRKMNRMTKQQTALNALVGFGIGVAGGLIGLGGAELRLPYLVGVLGLTGHQAVPVNLAISLLTILAAVPTRLYALPELDLAAFASVTAALMVGAVLAAWVGAGWLRRLSTAVLSRLIFVLLVLLGVGMLAEAGIALVSAGLLPASPALQIMAGFGFGLGIGAISSVLGVAGGEVIIPTLVFGYGVPVKAAGSLAMIISLPTVLTGIVRHARHGAFGDRAVLVQVIVPMAIASAAGAVIGALLAATVAAGAIKVLLGVLLIWSAWKVFLGRH